MTKLEALAADYEARGKEIERLKLEASRLTNESHRKFLSIEVAYKEKSAALLDAQREIEQRRKEAEGFRAIYANVSSCLGALEDAGMGGTGKPNTLRDQVEQIILDRDNCRNEAYQLRERLTDLHRAIEALRDDEMRQPDADIAGSRTVGRIKAFTQVLQMLPTLGAATIKAEESEVTNATS